MCKAQLVIGTAVTQTFAQKCRYISDLPNSLVTERECEFASRGALFGVSLGRSECAHAGSCRAFPVTGKQVIRNILGSAIQRARDHEACTSVTLYVAQ